MKAHEMGGNGKMRNAHRFSSQGLRSKNSVGDVGVDVFMILKQILETWGAGTWTVWSNGRLLCITRSYTRVT
jgi:hypothetical protein